MMNKYQMHVKYRPKGKTGLGGWSGTTTTIQAETQRDAMEIAKMKYSKGTTCDVLIDKCEQK